MAMDGVARSWSILHFGNDGERIVVTIPPQGGTEELRGFMYDALICIAFASIRQFDRSGRQREHKWARECKMQLVR